MGIARIKEVLSPPDPPHPRPICRALSPFASAASPRIRYR